MGNQRIKFDFLVHDLKVPLAVIETGIISLLEKREKYGELTDKQIKVLHRILRNTIVTKRLVNDALELGRSSEGIMNRSTFMLSNFIEEALLEIFDLTDHETAEKIKGCKNLGVLKGTLHEKGILLGIDEGVWCDEVCLDESKMRQILRNLLNNALKYRRERIELNLEKNTEALFISIKDDGEGIPESYHEKIFGCYFQLDSENTHCVRGHGLGLAGVMILVEDMGGKLFLDSDEGKGAAFSVQVPL
ncbi:MAG: HAMP domain-containing histidine kinase [Deltaproteobacteria bacterium]|nr:HAMP domain-containing histidine kinase [Deltaproteobacteria bacterium]